MFLVKTLALFLYSVFLDLDISGRRFAKLIRVQPEAVCANFY